VVDHLDACPGAAGNCEATLIEHVRDRLSDSLSMRSIGRRLAEFHDLQAVLATTT
jgi:hypothetical protein